MRIKILSLLLLLFSISINVLPQNIAVDKIEPPNWWTGMKWNKVQLMIYGTNLKNISARFNSNNILVEKITLPENSNYAFIDIVISDELLPGSYQLFLNNTISEIQINYEIKARDNSSQIHQGFNQADVVYLIVPDRFVNGDLTNDKVEGYNDNFDPEDPIARHGGDIAGMISKLDYLKELGITTIWSTPLIENNTKVSYHGYGATDLYKIDARFGTNDLYKKYVEEAHKRGLKIIYDHVSNHISINHPWMNNLPMNNWINGSTENHLNTRHDKMSYADIHRDSSTIVNLNKGWFTDYMPDINQKNPFVEKYLIQNMIWWLEFTGLDGIREDTYPYTDQLFLSRFNEAILTEYPNLNIVGEVWDGNPSFLSYFQKNSLFNTEFNSNLPVVTDFGLRDIIADYASGKSSLYKIYQTLAMDFLFADPYSLLVFVDNHDIARLMYLTKGDLQKAKNVLTMVLTLRGIPQLLYATEIGMAGAEDHGRIRSNFPGGFPGDDRDAFTFNGRTIIENELFDFLKNLLAIRKNNPGLSSGNLIQFPPYDNVYIYLKVFGEKLYLIAINDNDIEKPIQIIDYQSHFQGKKNGNDLFDNYLFPVDLNTILSIPPKGSKIFLFE